MHIVFPLFDRVTQLDFTAPHQVFSRVPGARVTVASLGGRDIVADGLVFSAVQLRLEYAPAPPFDAGRPESAPAEVTDRVRSAMMPTWRPAGLPSKRLSGGLVEMSENGTEWKHDFDMKLTRK